MPISDCCTMDVICCDSGDSVAQVAGLMREHHVGDVVVVGSHEDARVPIGIITDRDIVVEAIAPQVDLNLITAGDIMNSPLMKLQDSDGIFEALRLMRDLKVRRLPVVRDDGTLFGIVTLDDIVDLLAAELSMVAGVISKQPAVEKAARR